MGGNEVQRITVPAVNISEGGIADTNRVLQHRLKDGLHIARRAADDLEHLRRGCLLLKGLAQLGWQSHVLDSDHCLIGECGDQLDLLVVKGRTKFAPRR